MINFEEDPILMSNEMYLTIRNTNNVRQMEPNYEQ
jgi:hypothetical protein